MWIYHPPGEDKNPVAPAIRGLDERGVLEKKYVLDLKYQGKKGRVVLQEREEGGSLDPEQYIGAWLCLPRADFTSREPNELYLVELKGLPVRAEPNGAQLARVEDFFETGAHGVLVTRTPEGMDCLIPFHEDFIDWTTDKSCILIPRYNEFLEGLAESQEDS